MTKRINNNGKIKLIAFDLDGTLIDAFKPVERSINHTLRHFGREPLDGETIKRTVGWGDRHLLVTLIRDIDEEKIVRVYRAHHKDSLKRGSKLLPEAKRLLKSLKAQKYRLAIASNRPTRFSHIVMRHLGIRKYFDYVLCGDKSVRPKPYPDILKEILQNFKLKPSQALYVGDMPLDVITGNRAKVKTIAVLTGSGFKKDIQKQKPFKIIQRLDELLKVLA